MSVGRAVLRSHPLAVCSLGSITRGVGPTCVGAVCRLHVVDASECVDWLDMFMHVAAAFDI